jgi:hypothetical protein
VRPPSVLATLAEGLLWPGWNSTWRFTWRATAWTVPASFSANTRFASVIESM